MYNTQYATDPSEAFQVEWLNDCARDALLGRWGEMNDHLRLDVITFSVGAHADKARERTVEWFFTAGLGLDRLDPFACSLPEREYIMGHCECSLLWPLHKLLSSCNV